MRKPSPRRLSIDGPWDLGAKWRGLASPPCPPGLSLGLHEDALLCSLCDLSMSPKSLVRNSVPVQQCWGWGDLWKDQAARTPSFYVDSGAFCCEAAGGAAVLSMLKALTSCSAPRKQRNTTKAHSWSPPIHVPRFLPTGQALPPRKWPHSCPCGPWWMWPHASSTSAAHGSGFAFLWSSCNINLCTKQENRGRGRKARRSQWLFTS